MNADANTNVNVDANADANEYANADANEIAQMGTLTFLREFKAINTIYMPDSLPNSNATNGVYGILA